MFSLSVLSIKFIKKKKKILSGDDENVGLNVFRCWADTLGTIVEKIT